MKNSDPISDPGFERSKNRAGLIVFGSIIVLVATVFLSIRFRGADVLLNVSYDASHGFFHGIDGLYQEDQDDVRIRTSHAGSVEQASSVLRGLKVDVVTLASAAEIDAISEKGFIKSDWRTAFPHNSSPYSSTIVFLVRSGNPKNISDWDDLIRKDITLVIPSPKVSGAGRWAYLAAWSYAMEKDPDEAKAESFVRQLYAGEPALNKGARGTLIAFMSQGEGDVLVTWENEAWYALGRYGSQHLEIVYPSMSIKAEPAAAVVDRIALQRGTLEKAKSYLDFLFSPAGQKVAVENFLRPRDTSISLWDPSILSKTRLVSIEDGFGSWERALEQHFSEGGSFDRIYPSRP